MSDLGANMRAAREAAGVSLSAMSRRTHYSKALLGHLETGVRAVRPDHVTAYSRALGIASDLLYGPPDDPIRVAHEWLVTETPAALHSESGRRVGKSLASTLESRVIELRHLDDYVGGADLFPAVLRELSAAQTVVNEGSYSEATGRRLLTVVGELAQLAGWVASDAGRHVEAQRVYLSGVTAAQCAGRPALAGQLLSSLSYQVANVGNPADAALLARTAVAGVHDASPIVRTLLLERVAWASARARDHDGTRRALAAVDDSYAARSDGIEEPEWVYWLDRGEIDVMAGRCMIELGAPADAEPLLSSAIASYTPERAREVALYCTWLAEAYVRAGVHDAGLVAIERARRNARGIRSARLDARINEVEQLSYTP